MKSFEFNEEQFANLSAIATELLYDETDPRSPTYKRVLYRPNICWRNIIAWTASPVLFVIAIFWILPQADINPSVRISFGVISLIAYYGFTIKPAIICAIKIYQRYAPDSLRNKCRFEPSCSQYMIIAIEKYGVIKGIVRGVKRLRRCNVNNGGYDYP